LTSSEDKQRDPLVTPQPGDRYRDEETGVVKAIYKVGTKGNSGKGPITVYYWAGRYWESNGTKTQIPMRYKRDTLDSFRQWAARPRITYMGDMEQLQAEHEARKQENVEND